TSRLLGGSFTQVSRATQPLFDHLMIPTSERAALDAAPPSDDLTLAGDRILNPLLVNELANIGFYGATDPTPFRPNRTDLLGVFTTRHTPSAGVHAGVPVSTMLRLDPAVDSTWPDGRKMTDDTTDRMLTVIANGGASPVSDNLVANDQPPLATF